MRRSLTPTLPCQASHHPTPLLQPGVTPLAPGTPTPLPRTTPIALAHNAEGEIEVLTDDAGVAIGKRFWPPGTKQVDLVAVPNKAGPILGLVERNVLAQLQQFKNGPDAARIKQHLLRTAPSGERYDVAAEDRRIAKQTLDRELLQPTPKGVVEQYARSEQLRREREDEANVAFDDARLMDLAGDEADELGAEEYFERVERAKVAQAKARKAKLAFAKGSTKPSRA